MILFNTVKDKKGPLLHDSWRRKLRDKMNIKKNSTRSWIIVIKKRKKTKRKHTLKKICVVRKSESTDCRSRVSGPTSQRVKQT